MDFGFEQMNSHNMLLDLMSCCSCKSGLRTIGSCSHIISALYYIGIKIGHIFEREIMHRSSKHSIFITNISHFVETQKKKEN